MIRFVDFGEFASEANFIVSSKCISEIGQGFLDTMRGFIDDSSVVFVFQDFQQCLATFFQGKKSEKPEVVHMESRADKCCQKGRGSWNNFNLHISLNRGLDEEIGRIRNTRRSCIRDISHFFISCSDNKLLCLFTGAVTMKTLQRFGDIKMFQEMSAVTRVLADDEIGFPECAKCAKSDVFEISDRCCDE